MRVALVAFVIALCAGSAVAEVRTNKAGGVSVDIPSAWKVDVNKNGVLAAESADKTIGLMFWVVEKADAKESLKLLDKGLEGKVTAIKWGKASEANINGMKGIKNAGTAKVAGKDAFVMLAIVGPTPTKKGVIVFGAIEQSKLSEHKAELSNIFDSLKPVN
jgi:hypothetical protein